MNNKIGLVYWEKICSEDAKNQCNTIMYKNHTWYGARSEFLRRLQLVKTRSPKSLHERIDIKHKINEFDSMVKMKLSDFEKLHNSIKNG